MDPVTLIITALATDAEPWPRDVPPSQQAAHQALKALIGRRLASSPQGELVLARYEEAPDVWEAPLAAQLTAAGAASDTELLIAAQALLSLGGKAGFLAGKHSAGDDGAKTASAQEEDPADIATRLASNASSISNPSPPDGTRAARDHEVAQKIGFDARALARGAMIADGKAQLVKPAPPTLAQRLLFWRLRKQISGDEEMSALSLDSGSKYDVQIGESRGVQVGDSNVQVNIYPETAPADSDLARAKEIFLHSLKHREEFVGSFLKQALHQANTTFRFSMAFMTAGGIIVLIAGALALTHTHGSAAQPIALVSGLAGLIVGTSGAAFSLKADKARKHLAQQAERMHTQLLDERRFTEVAELLSGIKDDNLNDRARVALALRLMGSENEPNWEASLPTAPDK